jgi:SM-20-related protein
MTMLDLEAFARTPLQTDPCHFLVVPEFVRPDALSDINRDYPAIRTPGSFAPADVEKGPAFAKLLDELRSPELVAAFESKFEVHLTSLPLQVGVRRFTDPTDGNVHNDSRSKLVTALIYFNKSWDREEGRLRILRDAGDLDSHSVEVEPSRGTLIAFRRSENSFHGFKPCDGERRSIQMYWVSPKRGRRGGPKQTPEFFRRFKRLFKKG